MDGMNINNISHNLTHTWTLCVHVSEHTIFFFVLVWFQNAAYVTFLWLLLISCLSSHEGFLLHLLYHVVACAIFSTAIYILWCFYTSLCQSIVLLCPMPCYHMWAPRRKAALLLAAWYDMIRHRVYQREMLQCKALKIYPVAALNCCLPISWPGCLFLVFIATFIHSIVSTAGLCRKSRLV